MAGLLVIWVLISSLLAVSPDLHHRLHDDSNQSDHQCAITLMEHHQVLSSEPTVLVVDSPSHLIACEQPSQVLAFASFAYSAAPGRAPPVVSA